jgi:hypothetical protein
VQSWFAGSANVVESQVLHDAGVQYTYTSAQLEAAAAGMNGGPVVGAEIADYGADLDVPFSYEVSLNAFTDVESQFDLTYQATLADGSALPAWLSFDPVNRTFSGTPPSTTWSCWMCV